MDSYFILWIMDYSPFATVVYFDAQMIADWAHGSSCDLLLCVHYSVSVRAWL